MNKIQIIYSTLDSGQFVANLPVNDSILRDSHTLMEYALGAFYGRYCFVEDWKERSMATVSKEGKITIPNDMPELPKMVKLSCCIIIDDSQPIIAPAWYTEISGKYYWEELNPGEPRPF